MTPDESIQAIASRIRQCEMSGKYEIECPYCHVVNTAEAESLCCDLFGWAVAAILHRWQVEAHIERMEQVFEAASRN